MTGLHPAIILLALSIWGSLLGIVGMIIALPLTTLMISYYKRFIIGDETFVSEEGGSKVEGQRTVFTLQGVKAGTVEQWNSLPRGIYIVNGKLVTKN